MFNAVFLDTKRYSDAVNAIFDFITAGKWCDSHDSAVRLACVNWAMQTHRQYYTQDVTFMKYVNDSTVDLYANVSLASLRANVDDPSKSSMRRECWKRYTEIWRDEHTRSNGNWQYNNCGSWDCCEFWTRPHLAFGFTFVFGV